MRRSFEEKLRTFSQAQNQFEQEKKVALEELKGQHRQEVQELLRSHQSQNANYSKDQEKLGQLHKAEVVHPVIPSMLSMQSKTGNLRTFVNNVLTSPAKACCVSSNKFVQYALLKYNKYKRDNDQTKQNVA